MATTIPCSRKRKSACNSIFEVDVNDCSPEPSPPPADIDNLEPVSKFTKLESSLDSGIGSASSQETDLCVINECVSVEQSSKQNEEEEGELKDEIDSAAVSYELQNNEDTKPVCEEADKTVDHCVMNISFSNEAIAMAYKPHFVRFIKSFVELTILNEDELKISVGKDNPLEPKDWLPVDEDSDIHISKSSKKRKKSKTKKDLFVLDTNPSLSTKEKQCLRYASKFSVIEQVDNESEEKTVPVTAQTCFNCGGTHSLKDCPEPKNFDKINAARQKFRNHQNRAPRYHLESDQMYGHLMPGKLTEKLRKALGLRKKDLPPYIYKMRMLGYPPGWIEEAHISHSNLSMFDIEGQDVKSSVKKKNGIDPEKVVEYPGFNAPMEEGTYDDYRYYNVPPFSNDHSKQAMIDYINRMQEDNLEECSMEIDPVEENAKCTEKLDESSKDNTETSIDDDTKLGVEVKTEEAMVCPVSSDDLKHDEQCLDTKALDDLESKRNQLLAELGIRSVQDDLKKDEETVLNGSPKPQNDEDTKLNLSPKREEHDETKVNGSPKPNMVKKTCFGTPVLKSASPFSRLPKPENFSQDVSPVINFENLPNSTGKYEQMTGVLQKVRTALKSLQNGSKT